MSESFQRVVRESSEGHQRVDRELSERQRVLFFSPKRLFGLVLSNLCRKV